ncbi:MAG: glutamate mutase L [Tissierellales bacterium]|nr:glutamate mutase L [Tissierellales bacterium]
MRAVLLIDFGSTYTKLTAIDLDTEMLLGAAKAITTVETDIMDGFNLAKARLMEKLENKAMEFELKLACSSAAGGLKMITIGLVPDLTAEAAKRAALGAGARITGVYSFELTKTEMEQIKASKPEIILLSGGTDGGNKDCILHNARMISESIQEVPIVVAGNKNAVDEIEDLFKAKNIYYKITENVMPKLNVLNVEPAKEAIREIFMKKIIEAKGMKNAENFIEGILMPTPAAVLKAAQILADGTAEEEGIGDLVIIDIGGATTDVHSIAKGEPTKPAVDWKGLQEPYAKRTVEGDLGMRVSALSLWEASGSKWIRKYFRGQTDVENRCRFLSKNINLIAKSREDIEFDEALGMVAVDLSMERHAGMVENFYTPMGPMYIQTGKDLLNINHLIGTGGVLVHSANPNVILKAALYDMERGKCLKPVNPKISIDQDYILSAMGLLAERFPNTALRMMKKYLREIS